MKVKLSVVLFLLLALINVSAQFKSTVARVSEAATLEEIGHPIDPQPLIDRFNKANGIDPTKFVNEPVQLKKATAYNVGDKKNIWASNFVTNQFYLSPSTCRAVGTNCYVFVEDSMWATDRIGQSGVNSVMNAFDNATPANAAKGIYQTNVETFGLPPNIDGDSKIIIHILNIPDGYSGNAGEGYVAGYFYSVNQTLSHPNSNKAEIYYLDCKPLNLLTASGLNVGMGTAAHEFQHMIMYNYHPSQETFFNEAWSLVAEVVCGYGLYGQSGTQGYSNNTNRYLLNWNRTDGTDVLKDYSRAARFSLYLYEQFGVDILKKYTQSIKTGVDAFDNDVFPKLGTTRRFADVTLDWWIANYLNDKTVDSKWGYSYSPVSKVNPTVIANPNVSNSDGVNKFAAQYISFTSGKNLTMNFNRGTNSSVKVKAIKIGTGGKQVVDVAANADVNFSDFGTTYNNITFLVYQNNFSTTVPMDGTFSYTYTASGTTASGIQELVYVATEPTGTGGGSDKDTTAIFFSGISGAKLDSIKVAMRQAGTMQGAVYSYSGVQRPSPLSRKIIGSDFAAISSIATRPPSSPYPTPWPNWVKVDLTKNTPQVDVSNNFVISFVNSGDYSATTGNGIMLTTITGSDTHSYMYLHNPGGTSTANWYVLTDQSGSYTEFLVKAYVHIVGTDINEVVELLPSTFTLDQNYPNPFNPSTVISYTLPKQSRVQIKIYDAIGNEIRSLIDEEKTAGKYNILWDSRNNFGTRVSSGVYFYKINADGFAQTKKMVLMK